ncbi:Uncharacterised protein [uncultured archaeon]|nr:Uncharacterised protein [uncultured archaeon]
MKYNFNLKIQAMYGIVTFLVVLGILYIFTKELNSSNWITSAIIGITEFIVFRIFYKTEM